MTDVKVPNAGSSLLAISRFNWALTQRSVVIWGLSIAAMMALITAMYPSFESSMDLSTLVESYPEAMRDALGFESLDNMAQFLEVEFFGLFGPILAGIFALRMVIALIPNQEREGTLISAVLAQPIHRSIVLTAAAMATAVALGAMLTIPAIATWVAAIAVDSDLALSEVVNAYLGLWALSMFYAGATAAACGIFKGGGIPMMIGAGLLGVSFALKIVLGLKPELDWLEHVSPMSQYGQPIIDGLTWTHHGGLVAVAVVLIAVGATAYSRRDVV